MRYKLMAQNDGQETECGGQRKKTKQEIKDWVECNINACGLDWRVGFTIKFKNSGTIYMWRWIKSDETVAV